MNRRPIGNASKVIAYLLASFGQMGVPASSTGKKSMLDIKTCQFMDLLLSLSQWVYWSAKSVPFRSMQIQYPRGFQIRHVLTLRKFVMCCHAKNALVARDEILLYSQLTFQRYCKRHSPTYESGFAHTSKPTATVFLEVKGAHIRSFLLDTQYWSWTKSLPALLHT